MALQDHNQQNQSAKEQAYNLCSGPIFQPPIRARTLTIDEVEGGFIIQAYDERGILTRVIAPTPHKLARQLKKWANPTPATPPE